MLPAVDFLRTINVSEEGIERFQKMLHTQATTAEEFRDTFEQDSLPPGAFGGSQLANQLASHTSKAESKVVQAINDIAAGLRGYETSLGKHVEDTVRTDEDQAALLRTFTTATQCIQGEDFTAPASCQAPEGDDA